MENTEINKTHGATERMGCFQNAPDTSTQNVHEIENNKKENRITLILHCVLFTRTPDRRNDNVCDKGKPNQIICLPE